MADVVKVFEGAHEGPFKEPRLFAKSVDFDLDNGAGTTIDDVLLKHTKSIKILDARIVYTNATSGTVAAGNVKLGTAVGGAEIVAATAYGNAKAVGTQTDLVLVLAVIPAGTAVHCRHTGVAATAAGFAHVEIEYIFA